MQRIRKGVVPFKYAIDSNALFRINQIFDLTSISQSDNFRTYYK